MVLLLRALRMWLWALVVASIVARARATAIPSARPMARPSMIPTRCTTCPTPVPSVRPTARPTFRPSQPSPMPTHTDDVNPYPPGFIPPTKHPTAAPNWPTHLPTPEPSSRPTRRPTRHPTVRPTAAPTPHPTVRPTLMPTLPGTTLFQITFTATQQVAHCILPTPDENPRYQRALKATIARAVDPEDEHNITSTNVQSVVLVAGTGRRALFTPQHAYIDATLTYVVHITSYGKYDFAYFSNKLRESFISTGDVNFFTYKLQQFAREFNATGLLDASSDSLTSLSLVSLSGDAQSSAPKISQALIFGIAFGVGGGLCVLCTVFYLSSKGPRPWEDGYEEWFYKNEEMLRKSGIGMTSPGYAQQQQLQQYRRNTAEVTEVDEIPEYDETGPAEYRDTAASANGGTVSPLAETNLARRATVQMIPTRPGNAAPGDDAGQSPWAQDDQDRDSIALRGVHRL